MTQLSYAGIGARKTPPDILKVMQQTAYLLARNNLICKTGAATGADQAYGNGAVTGGGGLVLALPWANYEQEWVATLPPSQVTKIVLNIRTDAAAVQSVHTYHPTAAELTQGVFKLHARNYIILMGCTFVICWTPGGLIDGGTGQGIRIANAYKIKVHNLGNPKTLKLFKQDIVSRFNELPPNLH